MKRKRENKGITLIALIITIIVMLILVGVSVNVALNGGLFDTAKTATEKTEQAAQAEKEFMIYAQLIAEADELVERYPLELEVTGETTAKLTNDSIIDLYGEILQRYGTSYTDIESSSNTLTLTTAIKAANTFYEIYDSAVQNYQNEYLENAGLLEDFKDNFWVLFTNSDSFESFGDDKKDAKLKTLQVAFMYGKYNPNMGADKSMLMIGGNNTVKYTLMADADTYMDEKDWNYLAAVLLQGMFPGGSFPFEDVTGTVRSNFTDLANQGIDLSKVQLLKVTNENVTNIEIDSTGDQDLIGKIVAVIPVSTDKYQRSSGSKCFCYQFRNRRCCLY